MRRNDTSTGVTGVTHCLVNASAINDNEFIGTLGKDSLKHIGNRAGLVEGGDDDRDPELDRGFAYQAIARASVPGPRS